MKRKTDSQNRLMAALKFDQNDLELNQHGYLSKSQMEKLVKERNAAGFLARGIVWAGVILLVALSLAAWLEGSSFLQVPLCGFIVIIVPLLFTASLFRQYSVQSKDIKEKRVVYVEGVLRKEMRGTRVFFNVSNLRFRVHWPIDHAFEDDKYYRIYFLPNSRDILSAEWVP